MEDIAPKLLERIKSDFEKEFSSDTSVAEIYKKINEGTATYLDANEFSIRAGEILAGVFGRDLSSDILPDGRMYYNIAKIVVEDPLKNNYGIITDVTEDIQNILNKNAGIGIKAIKPEINEDRINGIIDIVSGKEYYDDISYMLDEPVVNFCQSIVDASVRANADFQYKSGLSPKIRRTAEGRCCAWCSKLAGTYDYEKVSGSGNDVFRRHKNCRCTVEYYPGKGGKFQNVYSKNWKTKEERDKIESRKIAGLISEDDEVMRNIRENIIPNQNISKIADRQMIHRVGSDLYEARKNDLLNRGEYGPSYITISDDKVIELVRKYSGKGKIKYNRKGEWTSQEIIVTNKEIIGVVVDNRNGNSSETSVFKIHYAKDGVHIVPDYPSKQR